ncbi:MAG: translation initiation factor IF-2, partial [Prolixibacteraceae bacterium]|nr:translation initiation factor IF-2 [Prolixibacteraceae bacterium]
MVAGKTIRLSKLAREFNVGTHTIVEFLHKKGFDVDSSPNSKVVEEAVQLLEKEYKIDISLKKESEKISLMSHRPKKEAVAIDEVKEKEKPKEQANIEEVKEKKTEKVVPEVIKEKVVIPAIEKPVEEKPAPIEEKIKVLGKIDLKSLSKPKKKVEKPAKVKKPIEVKKPIQKEKKKEKEKPAQKPVPVVKEEKPIQEDIQKEPSAELIEMNVPKVDDVKVVGKIDLANINQKTRPTKKTKEEKDKERKDRLKQKSTSKKSAKEVEGKTEDSDKSVIKVKINKLNGPTVVGKIKLPNKKDSTTKDTPPEQSNSRKKRRKRISKDTGKVSVNEKQGIKPSGNFKVIKQGSKNKRVVKKEVDVEDVQKQIKDTLARLTAKGKSKGSKHRRDKRAAVSEKLQADIEIQNQAKKVLKVTEFVSVNEFANMMDVSVTQIISSCMSLGLFVSINQRLDAETLSVVAEEFGYTVEFVSVE